MRTNVGMLHAKEHVFDLGSLCQVRLVPHLLIDGPAAQSSVVAVEVAGNIRPRRIAAAVIGLRRPALFFTMSYT